MKHKLLFALLCLVTFAYATKTNVTSSTLATALTSSTSGDTLLLAGGTYASQINFQSGKTLTLKSAGTGSVIFTSTIGGTATDTNCGLIFEGIVIKRDNSYVMDGSTFGNINLVAFRSDTIVNVARCLIRGGNTTATTLGTIELSNSIVANCGASGYCFLYPKFNVSTVNIRNNTFVRYFGGESLFRPQVTNTSNVLNFTFENNTVYKWSKASGYALCYAAAMQSTSSTYTFQNNIIAEPGIAATKPVMLVATGGTVTAKKNLIVNYGRFSLTTPSAVDTTDNHITANLYDPAIGFQDTTKTTTFSIGTTAIPYGDFHILSTSALATASTTSGIIGDPRWLKTVSTPVSFATSSADAAAGSTSPANTTPNKGDKVTATATVNYGYRFKEWRDAYTNTVVSTTNPYTFNISANTSLVAYFTQVATYNFSVNVVGSQWGQVTLSPSPVNGKYETGTVVTATVISNAVTNFLHWEDQTTSSTRTIQVTADQTLTATFDQASFITGWDFRNTSPSSTRSGDYYSDLANTGSFSMYNADGTSAGWLGTSGAYSPALPCARMWTPVANFSTPRYYQASFSTTGYKNIVIKSQVGACYHAYPVILMQYSLDGTNYTTVNQVDITSVYNSGWATLNGSLPVAAEGQTKVYVRWIEDATSSPTLGSASDVDGTSITNAFVFADVNAGTDVTAPVFVSSVPAEGSTTASANGSIVLTFDERVKAGTGDCKLGTTTLTPSFGSKTVSFAYSKLNYATDYTFTVPAGALTDASGNAYGGITIHFRTMVRPTPIAKTFDYVVAKDGSGNGTTLQGAIDAVPANNTTPFLIYVKNGTYSEVVTVASGKNHVHLIGQSRDGVVIQYTVDPSVLTINATDFYAENITLNNTSGAVGPRQALSAKGDRAAFKNIRLIGFQDTHFTGNYTCQYYQKCTIEGVVDFIYGGGDIFLDQCNINVTYRAGGGGIICAPSTKSDERWGFVFSGCTIDGDAAEANTYKLGRPWLDAPRAVYINTKMNILPTAEGWTDMGVIPALFAEYNSTNGVGQAIDMSNRKSSFTSSVANGAVTVSGLQTVLTDAQAAKYTMDSVFTRAPNWQPLMLTEATNNPANLAINGSTISWDATPYAICYAVSKNDVTIGFTTSTSYTDASYSASATYKVVAVAESGALSAVSSISGLATGLNDATNKLIATKTGNVVTLNNVPLNAGIQIYSLSGMLLVNAKSTQTSYSAKVAVPCVVKVVTDKQLTLVKLF